MSTQHPAAAGSQDPPTPAPAPTPVGTPPPPPASGAATNVLAALGVMVVVLVLALVVGAAAYLAYAHPAAVEPLTLAFAALGAVVGLAGVVVAVALTLSRR